MTLGRRALHLLGAVALSVAMGSGGMAPAMAADTSAPTPAQTQAQAQAQDKPWGPGQLVDPQAGWLDEISCPSRAVCWMVDSYGNVVSETIPSTALHCVS